MKFSSLLLFVLGYISISQVQAQNIFLKATSNLTREVLTLRVHPENTRSIHDSQGIDRSKKLADYSEILKMGYDTEQIIDLSNHGSGAGRVTFKPLTISKHSDASTPKFFLSQFQGELMTLEMIFVDFHSNNENPSVAHKVIFRDAAIQSITIDSNDGCLCQDEIISFEYGTIEIYTYTRNTRSEYVPGFAVGWDRINNKSVLP